MKQITQEVLTITKELIAIRSETTHNDICLACLEYIQRQLVIESEIIMIRGVPSLIAKNFDGKRADVVLNGHIDVVSCGESQWTSKVVGDRLYGRGSGDMKAGVALLIKLFNEIVENNPKNTYMLMLTSDEEIGGFDGVGSLCDQGYGGDVVLIPDGGSTESIVVASKGVLNIGVLGKGKASHASRPWLGDTLYEDFIQFFESVQEMIYTGSTETWRTTATVTELNIGHARNAVPHSLKGTIDMRFTQEWTIERLRKSLNELVKKFPLFTLSMQGKGDLVYADEKKNPLIKKYLHALEGVVGKAISIKEDGSSDGRHFAQHGSTVILHRPTCENIHADDEWCSIEGIEKVYETYKLFIENL